MSVVGAGTDIPRLYLARIPLLFSRPSSRMPVNVSSLILSIVRPCFGQTCTECLALVDLVQVGRERNNEFHDGPESN
jgi:hypothetical protein